MDSLSVSVQENFSSLSVRFAALLGGCPHLPSSILINGTISRVAAVIKSNEVSTAEASWNQRRVIEEVDISGGRGACSVS